MRLARLFALSAFIFVTFFAQRDAFGWSQHYLVTDRALSQGDFHFLGEKVRVEPLEEFLGRQKAEVAALFDGYYDWLAQRGSRRFRKQEFDVSQPTVAEFLGAARLHPASRFPLVRRIMPGEVATGKGLNPSDVLQADVTKPEFLVAFEDVTGMEVSARSVLMTFSDEPDWMIDHELWGFTQFGYGEIPYGQLKGTASRSAFHLQFRNENLLVRFFAPEMLDGMVFERVELFSRLAVLAYRTGHPYWGYRFTAWALHYVEDLGQPYHSRAVPGADFWYYLKFAFSGRKAEIKRETTQYVKNRHFAYEDFVGYVLQQSYLEKSDLFSSLAARLSTGEPFYNDAKDMASVLTIVGDFAAFNASSIDRAIVAAYGPRMTQDPGYDLESDKDYSVKAVVDSLSGDARARIIAETGKDFENTARAVRTAVRMILNSGGRKPDTR